MVVRDPRRLAGGQRHHPGVQIGGRRWLARLGQYALVLWVALSLNFLLPHLAPGDPIDFLAGDTNSLSAEGRAQLERTHGVDGSVLEQYGRYWGRLATGDLGSSVRNGRPVAAVLVDKLPWTIVLMVTAAVVAALVAVVAGATAARRRGRRTDTGLVGAVLLVDAMPSFWIAMVLVAVFSVQLGWFPSFGAVPLDAAWPDPAWLVEAGRRLVLPVVAVVLSTVGPTFLLARAAMVSALESPFVLLAEATGLSPRRIVYRHALRNALLPVVTNLALTLGTIVSGVVIVETVFSYPGLGRQIYEAVLSRDYPSCRAPSPW
ncbi:MAG TPA: ABC transporter permease [Acidimicrobiales bacterium]